MKRFISTERLSKRTDDTQDEARTPASRDQDRIMFSSVFRRLQGKTQVFPLSENDLVHNRLTHSLEVASVARSLGQIAGNLLKKKQRAEDVGYNAAEVGKIVQAAALAHDIGNTPFGHAGEDAIRQFFIANQAQFVDEKFIDSELFFDFTRFDGNAMAFRWLVSRGYNDGASQFGMDLTKTVLASMVKYPWSSSCEKAEEGKFGFFQQDVKKWEVLVDSFRLNKKSEKEWMRHPFAYLTEAADDICYLIIDLEDASRLGILNQTEVSGLLKVIADDGLKSSSQSSENDYARVRADAINNAIFDCATVFYENWEDICNGQFEGSLIKSGKYGERFKGIKSFAKDRVYNVNSVVRVELAGYEIISELLDLFVGSVLEGKRKSIKGDKVYNMIPSEYRLDAVDARSGSIYYEVLNVVDYVAGMTDRYALNLYRNIKGVALPGDRVMI